MRKPATVWPRKRRAKASPHIPDEIVVLAEQLVRDVEPAQVILFGSQARGDIHQWSDVDLLVVLSNGRDEREALQAARKAVHGSRLQCDLFVATTDRVRKSGDVVGTIFRPALREGRLLYDGSASPPWDTSRLSAQLEVEPVTQRERTAATREWLDQAGEELRVAEMALTVEPAASSTIGYLSQQVAEKALKAVLVFLQIEYQLSHNLDEIRNAIPGGWQLKHHYPELDWLAEWAVAGRYPGSIPTEAEAQRALQHARAIFESVERDLRAHGFVE